MKNILILLLVLIVSSCTKFEAKHEGATPLSETIIEEKNPKPIVFADEYSITLTNTYFDKFKKIYQGTAWIEGMALNDKLDRVAYKTASGNVRIIDTSGSLIQEVSNSANVVSFEFYQNGILYMADDNGNITFNTGSLPIRSTNLSSYITDLFKLQGVLILEDYQVLAIYQPNFNSQPKINLSSRTSNLFSDDFSGVIDDVTYMRAYNYSETVGYEVSIGTVQSSSSSLGCYRATKYSTSLSEFYVQSDDIYLERFTTFSERIQYDYGEYLYYRFRAVEREWEGISFDANIRFIDF